MTSISDKESAAGRTIYYEEILERCCGSGRWQALLITYFSLMWLLFPAFSMSMMFVGATPEFKCADDFDSNATFTSLPADTPQCHRLNTTDACTRWVFDTSVYESTVVTEWSLVCGRKPLLSMLQSWLMIGGIAGSLVSGQLADRFGRRLVFLPSMLLATACAFAAALVTDYTSFAAVRFLTGVAVAGMMAGQLVLVTELGSVRQRAAHITTYFLPFAIGIMLMAAGSYAVRTRWLLQLVYAVPFLVLLPNIWLMPESPRWLVIQGRFAEASEVLRQGARWNRHQMPQEEEVLQLMQEARDGMLAREEALQGTTSKGPLQRVLQLVRTLRMRRRVLIMLFISFVIAGSYFGISFDMTQLSENPHLAAVLSGIGEIPSFFIFPLLNWFGRRRSMAFFLFVTAAAIFVVIVSEDATLRLVVGLIAKLTIASSFNALAVYLSELLPTEVRGVGNSVNGVATRTGAALAPFVVDLVSQLHETAPSAVFGAATLLASLATLLLPETAGQRMPETIADVEAGPVAAAAAPAGTDQAYCNAGLEVADGE